MVVTGKSFVNKRAGSFGGNRANGRPPPSVAPRHPESNDFQPRCKDSLGGPRASLISGAAPRVRQTDVDARGEFF